jgi:hypothetical protein
MAVDLSEHEFTREQLYLITAAVQRIQKRDMAWRIPHVDDVKFDLLIVEATSVGVFEGYCDEVGYWAYDGETYPATPLLVKRVRERGLRVAAIDEAAVEAAQPQ